MSTSSAAARSLSRRRQNTSQAFHFDDRHNSCDVFSLHPGGKVKKKDALYVYIAAKHIV